MIKKGTFPGKNHYNDYKTYKPLEILAFLLLIAQALFPGLGFMTDKLPRSISK